MLVCIPSDTSAFDIKFMAQGKVHSDCESWCLTRTIGFVVV